MKWKTSTTENPTQQKLQWWKLDVKKTQHRGSDKKPSVLEMVTAKQTQQKAHTAQSQIPENLQLRQEALAPMAGRTYG